MSKIIVTGGCGYIGSHTIVDLIQHGFEAISIDDLSRADSSVFKGIEKITGVRVKNHKTNLVQRDSTLKIFEEHQDAVGVIHFAAYKSVPESTQKPFSYYRNNMESLYNVVEGIERNEIPNLVFSSSCSVYGIVKNLPVTEDTPFGKAESPYARTKQHGEQLLEDMSGAANFKTTLLRYFNPVGAHPSAEIGELPIGVPNNLIPFITQTAIGKREMLTVFGGDYPTRDGSCVRDYIHVCDIAHAHTLALKYLIEEKQSTKIDVFNLGTGNGISVLEVIRAFENATEQKLKYKIGPRRVGDVIEVYANNTKAKEILNWELKYNLNDMMQSAWNWEKKISRD